MDASEKIARHRLSVLELAQKLGNVAAACRNRGMTRTQFYEYKKRFETQGLEGLKDLPPIHKTHPQTTPPEIEEKIVALSLAHPAKGCWHISSLLALEGIKVSGVTVQRVLSDRNLSTKLQRWLALEKKGQEDLAQLSGEQTTFVEDQNPQFKERHVESGKPGELLNQDTYFVGHLGALGKVYLHTVVDTYGSMGWGLLHTTKKPEAAAAVLYNDVLPFYKKHRLTVENILTDNGREFCGTDTHPFQVFLALNDIGHRRIKPRTPRTNGFVERFHKTLGDEFFGPALRSKGYTSLDALQSDLDAWLDTYNYQRPHQGYRNHGRIPFATVQRFITTGDGLSTESATAVAALPRGEARASANLTRSPPKKSHARKESVTKTK